MITQQHSKNSSIQAEPLTPAFGQSATPPISFIGPPDDPDWSINQYDPAQLSRIKASMEYVRQNLPFIPPNIMLINGSDEDVGVSPGFIGMSINAIDHYGENAFLSVLAHEASHVKHEDEEIFSHLENIKRDFFGVSHAAAVFDESQESFAGLVIKKFGSLDSFETTMLHIREKSDHLTSFLTTADISADTPATQIADRMRTDPEFKNQLLKAREINNQDEPAIATLGCFYGQTIAQRQDEYAMDISDHFEDYESFLPADATQRDNLIQHATQIYQDHMPHIAPTCKGYDKTLQNLLHATEYRSDAEAAETFGAVGARQMLSHIMQHYNDSSDITKASIQTSETHPHPEDRICFIQERYPLPSESPAVSPQIHQNPRHP